MRRLRMAALVVAGVAALWYLRDPSWLAGQTTGLRLWERDAGGTAFRWSEGHASFFVPSNVRAIRVPVATTFDPRQSGEDRPMTVTFTIDDRRAGRILLADPQWQEVTLVLPPPGGRRLRRVDVRTSVTREDNHGVKIGELRSTGDGENWRLCCYRPR